MNEVKRLQTLTDHFSDVNSLDFAADHLLVTGSGDKRIRLWEWRQSVGYVQVTFSPLTGHKYGVTCVKISPQSTMLASSSIDGTTLLWNIRTGTKVYTMVQPAGEAVRVSRFSPDSTLLVTGGDNGQVCIWDLIRRTLIRSFAKHEGAVQSVSFSPDSFALVTTCTLGVLNLFATASLIDSCLTDSEATVPLASIDDAHDLGVVSSDFSPIQRVTSNEPYTKLYRLVTCGNDHLVKLWEIRVTREKCGAEGPSTAKIDLSTVMEKHSSALTCVRFSPNGLSIASTGLDKTTVIWETNTGKPAATISGHTRYVACCAFSKDGNLLATGSNDKSAIVWDLTGGHLSIESELVRRAVVEFPLSMANTDKGRAYEHEHELMQNVQSFNNQVELIQRLAQPSGVVNSVAFHQNFAIAVASGDKLVRIWSLQSEAEASSSRPIGQRTSDLRTGTEDSRRFREEKFSPLEGHKYSVNRVEYSPCGTMLASCSLDGTVILWDAKRGETRGTFVNSGYGIRVCRWSPDGTKIATAGDDEKTTLWDVNTMGELRVFEGHSDAVNAVAFTHDSRYLAAASNEGTWRLYDILRSDCSGPFLTCEEAHDLGVQGCDFSPTISASSEPSGETRTTYFLASCGNDSLVKLWQLSIPPSDHEEAAEGRMKFALDGSTDNEMTSSMFYQEKKSLTGHGGNVTDLRFSPTDGEILASVATDKTARIWNVFSATCLYVLEGHDSLVTSCAFSKDASLFATGSLDRTVLVWKIPRLVVSQTVLLDNLRNHRKRLVDWNVDDTLKWLNEVGLPHLAKDARTNSLVGRELLFRSEHELALKLRINQDGRLAEEFRRQVYWLKRQQADFSPETTEISDEESEIPYEFLCPITHEIMKEPVQCSDGFTYEKAAVSEWFLCGKYTSPMTNEILQDTSLVPNIPLRNAILTFIYGDVVPQL